MIEIKQEENCVGCNGCVQACPTKCINLEKDKKGFSYPKVNTDLCIGCNLCENVCPVINQHEEHLPCKAIAGWIECDNIRRSSSSGGVFYVLAKHFIEQGGVVFGARFNSTWQVEHGYVETIDKLPELMRSKYLQSSIGSSFLQARNFLNEGRKVLFSGTPCQLAALSLFLRKEYSDQLLKVDVACHGVPSPKVWADYLNLLSNPSKKARKLNDNFHIASINTIKSINFRDKRLGWDNYGLQILTDNNQEFFQVHHDNLYMNCFLRDLCLRPSCHSCPAKAGKSGSDLTIADFWGIKDVSLNLYNDKGVSLILINSEIGQAALDAVNIKAESVNVEDAIRHNPAIIKSISKPVSSESFWDIAYTGDFVRIANFINPPKPTLVERAINKVRRHLSIL